ncbi:MAG: alpha/beta fold hydrolase [Acidiferrobacterales bacterium]
MNLSGTQGRADARQYEAFERKESMAKIEINGAELNYIEKGSGPPLIFVHGSASDLRTWQYQQDEFAKQFRTIAYSRRYHWPNEEIGDGIDYAMPQHVEDLGALIRSLDAGPATLVGNSLGAFLCLLLAIKEPGLVRNLVLAEPPVITLFVSSAPKPQELLPLLFTRPRTAAAIIKFGAAGVVPATRALKRGDIESGVHAFAGAVFGRGGYDRFTQMRKQQVNANLSNIRAEILGPGFASLDDRDVQRVQAPTLLLNGQRSISLFHLLTDRLEELLPDTTRVEIPEAAHCSHEDNPADYNRAVLEFLDNCGH